MNFNFETCTIKSEVFDQNVEYKETAKEEITTYTTYDENLPFKEVRINLSPVDDRYFSYGQVQLRKVRVNINPIKFDNPSDFAKAWRSPFCVEGLDNDQINEDILENSQIENQFKDQSIVKEKVKSELKMEQTDFSSRDMVIHGIVQEVDEIKSGLLRKVKDMKEELEKTKANHVKVLETTINSFNKQFESLQHANEIFKRETIRQKKINDIIHKKYNDKLEQVKLENDHAQQVSNKRIEILKDTIKLLKSEGMKNEQIDNLKEMVKSFHNYAKK